MLPSGFSRHYQLNTTSDLLKNENNQIHNSDSSHFINPDSKPKHDSSAEVNLIDLLNDVHITPQNATENKEKEIADYQLKMLEEFLKTSKATSKQNECHRITPEQESELNTFFDKYESNNQKSTNKPMHRLKYEDLCAFEQKTELSHRRLEEENAHAFNHIHVDVAKILVPRLDEEHIEHETDDKEKVDEDLIDEVMFEKNLEKLLLSKTIATPINKDIKHSSVAKIPHANRINETSQTSTNYKKYVDQNIFNEIVMKNQIKHITAPTLLNNFSPRLTTAKLLNVPTTNSDNNKDATDTKTKLQKIALTEELVTKYNIKYLETVKKVEKTFQKRSILKSESEKSKLTPGPSLYEKTVVLPQMMQRLNEKLNTLEEQSTIQMRLILDAGQCTKDVDNSQSSTKKTQKYSSGLNSLNPTVLNAPEVLLADCNKERLIAFEAGKLFENFVRNGSHIAP